ncbi:MAG: hypothetical protein GY820_02040 [Gammaproteobacteria bacterium]|nr:hypothetical protein [Gammaproteobacteria bacterium]
MPEYRAALSQYSAWTVAVITARILCAVPEAGGKESEQGVEKEKGIFDWLVLIRY